MELSYELQVINNKRLRMLIYKSAKFNQLSEEKKRDYIQKIAAKSLEKQQELCDFFKAENQKEEEKNKLLSQLYNDIVDLEHKMQNLIRKAPEIKAQSQESQEMEKLIEELEEV